MSSGHKTPELPGPMHSECHLPTRLPRFLELLACKRVKRIVLMSDGRTALVEIPVENAESDYATETYNRRDLRWVRRTGRQSGREGGREGGGQGRSSTHLSLCTSAPLHLCTSGFSAPCHLFVLFCSSALRPWALLLLPVCAHPCLRLLLLQHHVC